MKIAVRYYSRGGNAKKVATAIAKAVGVEAKDCSVAIDEPVDLLFLGGSVYWAGIDKHLKQFIAQLDPDKVQRVASFGTSALKKDLDKEVDRLVRAKNIPVSTQNLQRAADFALAVVAEGK